MLVISLSGDLRQVILWNFAISPLLHQPEEKMPVPVSGSYQSGNNCWDRVKMGFLLGLSVGMASGALFGGFNALRHGLRGRELIQITGKVMLQGGGTFGTFMAIGTGIRC